MSDDKAYSATPAETLEQHIMDSSIAKSEAEWWASRTIESLLSDKEQLLDLIRRLTNTIEFLNSTHNAGEAEDIVAEARKVMERENEN